MQSNQTQSTPQGDCKFCFFEPGAFGFMQKRIRAEQTVVEFLKTESLPKETSIFMPDSQQADEG